MSLLASAASDPLPMAQPTSAAARAGASLMPSPTMSSCREPSRMEVRASTLPAGLRLLRAEVIPSSAATVCTAGSLSPLRMDEGESECTEVGDGRKGLGSQRGGHGDGPDDVRRPARPPPPSRRAGSARSPRRQSTPAVADSTTLLTWISWPSRVPITPTPGSERTSVARSSDPVAAMMARAIGCWLSASTAAASDSTSSFETGHRNDGGRLQRAVR